MTNDLPNFWEQFNQELPEDDNIVALSRDLKRASDSMEEDEARFMVDAYYMMQEQRKASSNQLRSMDAEPHDVLQWLVYNSNRMENQIKSALDVYTDGNKLSQWSKSVFGINRVLSAGLLAHIDIDKAKSPASIWRFAGLDPTVSWNKGEKRPWNAELKTLCWKIGDSFVKTKNKPKDFYGHLYQDRRDFEDAENEAGNYAEEAEKQLTQKNYGKNTEAYKIYSTGKLPPNHMFSRSKRWTVKLFLSHYWQVGKDIKGTLPPDWKPWVISIGGHQDIIDPPNWHPFGEWGVFHPEDIQMDEAAD